MTRDGPDSWQSAGPLGRPSVDAGPLGLLPSLSRRQVRLERRLGPVGPGVGDSPAIVDLADLLGVAPTVDRFEVHWRGAGLRRPGAIAQLTWPRLSTRVGLGIETPLAHAIVDQLLGHERPPAEGRLQITPVEWGILGFAIARGLDRLDNAPGPFGPWDLSIDRVGPDPFDPAGLGPIVTWRWRVALGSVIASARLWLPESLIAPWVDAEPDPSAPSLTATAARFADLSSDWRAEAGTVALPRGTARLRPGSLHLIEGAPLRGTPRDPDGPIELAQVARTSRWSIPARAVAGTSAARLSIAAPMRRTPIPREAHVMNSNPAADPPTTPAVAPGEVPVTLTVELGRVSLPLHMVAGLKPGDVVELGRHSREPVELTSAGRLVARGELVQVDTELGVRVTQVFL